MAVIEIAKIQVRRGQENQTGLPVLAGGEFAWAADTESLYIGLRREDGGARDANVRILTENDLRNFFNSENAAYVTGAYTYRSGTEITVYNTGSSIQTEYYPGTEIIRTLQDRLDDFAIVKNFGVSGDGGDNTQDEFIQLAIDKLYISTASEFSLDGNISPPAKILYFPTGNYAVTGTIYIPKNTTILGEGIDKTVFILKSNGEHIFQTIDGVGRRDDAKVPGTQGVFTTSAFSITGPDEPSNIRIEGVTLKFESTSTVDITGGLSLLSLDCADSAVIRNVKFEGNYDFGRTADDNYTAIDMRGYTEGATTENVLIEHCQFIGFYNGITSNYDVNNIVIQNNYFYQMHHGIAFNKDKNAIANTGPRFAKILNNKFRAVESEAIYAGDNGSNTGTNHVSMNNQFINVGNSIYGNTSTTGTSIITFLSRGNSSINDYFDRQNIQDQYGGLITYNPLISGSAAIDSTYASTSSVAVDSSTPIMRLPITGNPQYLTIKYSCKPISGATGVDRMGVVQYYIKAGSDPEVIISDDFNSFNSDGALYWGAFVDSSNKVIGIRIFNPSVANGGSGLTIYIEFQSKLIL